MSYTEQVAKAEKQGRYKTLSMDIVQFTEAGQQLVGKLIEVTNFEGGKFDNDCKKYLFDTDEGPKSCILGASVDKQLDGLNLINHLIVVKYGGKKEIGGGKQVNIFDVRDYGKI